MAPVVRMLNHVKKKLFLGFSEERTVKITYQAKDATLKVYKLIVNTIPFL